jgi:phosphate-selective porin OprO and OprP
MTPRIAGYAQIVNDVQNGLGRCLDGRYPQRMRLLICLLMLPAFVVAQGQDIVPAAAVDAVPEKKPTLELPTAKWTGQFQSDLLGFTQDEASRAQYGLIPNAAGFRRARVGLLGEYGAMDYRIEVDFALAGRPSFLDVYARVVDVPVLGRVRVGHYFEPYSLDRVTPNRFMTFLERTSMDQAFVPARNTGLMISNNYVGERISTAFGLFRADSDNFGNDTGNRYEWAVTGRVTGLPIYVNDGESLLHLGLGYSFRGPNNDTVRFRAQPELRLGDANPNPPFLVDTGAIAANAYHLIGPELAGVLGPLSFQTEATLVPVHRRNDTLFFTAWYTEVACFLTGEHRPYAKNNGTFGRVSPLRDFLPSRKAGAFGGPGAIQVAWRISQLNLNDGNIRGGRLTELTHGVNWHLNSFTRLQANYLLILGDHANKPSTVSHGFGLRLGFEF